MILLHHHDHTCSVSGQLTWLFLMDEVMRQIFLRIFLFTPVSLHSAIAPYTYLPGKLDPIKATRLNLNPPIYSIINNCDARWACPFFVYPMMHVESLNTTLEQVVIGWHQLLDIIHSINAVRGTAVMLAALENMGYGLFWNRAWKVDQQVLPSPQACG